AGERLVLDAAAFSGDGTVVSDKDLSIALTTDVVNNGAVSAGGALSYVTTGTFTNNSKLYATQTLTVGGADVLNNVTGEMSAGQKTVVNASGTLDNRGLIDGVDTQVNAGTLNNLGTGRIYGDRISLAAGTLNNGAETVNGATSAASIAARDTLHIGANVINNSGHAQIFSFGDAAIGGALDGNRQAIGQAATLNNSAATIDIGGNLRLAVDQVNNLNPTIRTEQVAGPTQKFLEYAPLGANYRLSGGTYDRRSTHKDQTYAYYTTADGQTIQATQWYIWDYERNTAKTQVVAGSSDPGQILVGGNLNYSGGLLRNQASKIVIGGALTGAAGALKNEGLDGVETTTDHGTATHSFTKRGYYSGSRRNRRFETVESYDPAVPDRTFVLNEYTYERGQKPTNGNSPGAQALSNVTANTATAGQVNGGNRAGVITEVATGVDGVVRTSQGSNGSVPTASLFRTAAGGHYLVETDPRFAGYRNWLSSDYLLNALGQDPSNIQKRLGDGFYEQKLIREQIAQLTGYRYLDGFESDETQYTALMNAGVTFAQAYRLRPGIGLSAAQMAQLTSDIVWLVEQSVTLADGSTQRVLVPQVYVRVKPGDIDG
ncbi:MAG: S-layer family protein, partial [Comamonadaceae bacterium]